MNISGYFKLRFTRGTDTPTKVNSAKALTASPSSLNQKFSFRVFGCVAASLMISVGALNWLIDPLWYSGGNRLTGKNFPFNERVSKTNLFLRSKTENYDCLIIGSSRVVALNASEFKQYKCFNYSFKGGWAQDFVNVSKFVEKEGLKPKVIYVGVDEFNFVKQQDVKGKKEDFSKFATPSPYHAYFSSNVLLFSLMTLANRSPDPANYYNQSYETIEFNSHPKYNPAFLPLESSQQCDLSRLKPYLEIRRIFPTAKIIGYVPPRSAWSVVNETYNRNIMDCVLQGFHEVSKSYDEMYDFSVPSSLTLNPANTYDGSHFTPQANDEVIAVLEKRNNNFALNVGEYSLEGYKKAYKSKLKEFLVGQSRADLWQN